jgi:hypothetical protein
MSTVKYNSSFTRVRKYCKHKGRAHKGRKTRKKKYIRKKSQRRRKRRTQRRKRRRTRKKRGGTIISKDSIDLKKLNKLLIKHEIVKKVPILDEKKQRKVNENDETLFVKKDTGNGIKWGENGTKTVNKLLKEIKSGETILKEENGKLFREVRRIVIEIFNNESKTLILQEKGHYDSSGNLDKAKSNKDLREKMYDYESPTKALTRAINEELGEKYSRDILYFKGDPKYEIEKGKKIISDSYSYPGLQMHTTEFREELYIPLLTKNMNASPNNELIIEETYADGKFKRYIKWGWVRNE